MSLSILVIEAKSGANLGVILIDCRSKLYSCIAMFFILPHTEKYNFFCLSFNQIQYLDSFISGAQVKFVLCTHFGQNDYLPTYKLKTVSMSTLVQ